jgi:hypothetical protein
MRGETARVCSAIALAVAAVTCGGEAFRAASGEDRSAGASDARADEPDATAILDAPSTDAQPAPPDGGARDADAAPDPTRVTLSYAIGKNQIPYVFDFVSRTFTARPSAGCPSGEETAVFSDKSVYFTSSDNTTLYAMTDAGCSIVKSGSSFPYALGVAPAGTVSASAEVLVGYMGAGDYVRIDRTNGNVTVINAGALGGLRPAGDLTAIGTKGYLAAITGAGSCPGGGDCIVEVNLTTGVPIGAPRQLVGFGIYGLAHAGGRLLLFANGAVYPFDVAQLTLGAALASFPPGASFSGAGAAPYP